LQVLDAATGKQIWRTNILTDAGAKNIQWGMSGSPLIADGKVIVNPGGPSDHSIVAYDKTTGKQVWSSLSDEASYTSPMLVTFGGRRQVLAVTASRAVGLSLEDGKLLWEFPWVTDFNINSAQPIILPPNRFFISAGYGHGAALVELTQDGTVTQAKQLWSSIRMKNKFNSSVLYQGHIYGLDDGILACINAETGELKWKGGRYGFGQLVLASGHLVVISEEGELILVKATPEKLEEVSRFQAIEGKTWNYPAITNGILLVRNANEMAAFKIGK
jgi:outer membrane protein assembly factor BamB